MAMTDSILRVKLLFDSSQAKKGLNDTGTAVKSAGSQMEGVGSKLKASFGTAAAAAGLAFGADTIVTGIKDTITAASDLNETVSKSGQVFGDSAKAILDWSKNSSNAMGLSQQAAIDAATNFAVFGKSAGLAGQPLVGFSEGLTGLASDMASFSNTTPDEAIQALGAALRGESEPIRKYGVLLNEQVLKQRAVSEGIVKGTVDAGKVKTAQATVALAQQNVNKALSKYGKGSSEATRAGLALTKAQQGLNKAAKGTVGALTPAQKILAAQKEIMAQTKDTQGDFARTSDQLANKQRILAAQMENVKATVGTALLPAVLSAISGIMALGRAFATVFSFIKDNQQLFTAIGIGLATIGVIILASVVPAFLAWAGAALAAAAATLLGIAPFILIGAAVAALAYLIIRNWSTIKAVTAAVFGAVVGFVKSAFNWIKSNWPLLLAIITGPIGIAVLLIAKNFDTIKNGISSVLDFFRRIAGQIGSALAGVAHAISAPFVAGFEAVKEAVQGAIKWVTDKIDSLKRAVSAGIQVAKDVYNVFARGWNAFEVKIPAVKVGPVTVPGTGKTLGLPDIPLLASGAYVDRATLAVIGEGRGSEFVSPEPMLRKLIREESGSVTVNVNVPATANPAETGREVARVLRSYFGAGGRLTVPS